jgi:hypothetical protein
VNEPCASRVFTISTLTSPSARIPDTNNTKGARAGPRRPATTRSGGDLRRGAREGCVRPEGAVVFESGFAAVADAGLTPPP